MHAVQLKGVTKVYDNGVNALRAVDLNIARGDFFGLLGPNGAGKSTTIGILSSLVLKTSGKVLVLEHDIDTELEATKALLGIVPQEVNLLVFGKAFDIVVDQAGFYGIERSIAMKNAEKYLRILQLWEKKDEIIRNLSGGMKRRLMIARALVHEPEILILDEPTAGVDVEIRRLIWQFLKDLNKSGKTIILTSHYLEEVEHLCNTVAIINHGQVIKTGSVREITSQIDREIFEAHLVAPIEKPEQIAMLSKGEGHNVRLVDSSTIEITIEGDECLGDIITALTNSGIRIKSISTNMSRLEEMFLQLTGK